MELKDQLALLIKHHKWGHVRSWFSYWKDADEQAEKVLLWGKLFLPTYFKYESPDFHRVLVKKFFSNKNEYTAAPRGFAKTSINQTCIMFSCAYELDKFIVLIEKSFTEASEVMFAIRDEFVNNDRIIKVYGNLIKQKQGDKAKDAQGDLFVNGVRLRAKGFNTPIRGLKSKEWRPTRIIVDDVEEDTHVVSEEQRRKYKANYTQGIIPAVDIEGTVKMVGTILHYDSLLSTLIEQHEGDTYRAYDPEDPEHTLLWPDRWPLHRLEEKKEQMMLSGFGSSKFAQEYLNDPVDDESRTFKWEWLQNEWEELPENVAIYSTIDVAESEKKTADYTGVITVAVDEENNWYILRAERHRVGIKGLIDMVFRIWKQDEPSRIGIEKKALEYQIKPLLEDKSNDTQIYPSVFELKHGGRRKEDRIRGALEGRFELGKIYFKAGDELQKRLRGELYDFPRGKHDDLVDALAYIDQFSYKAMKNAPKKVDRPTVFDDTYYRQLAMEGAPSHDEGAFQDWETIGS